MIFIFYLYKKILNMNYKVFYFILTLFINIIYTNNINNIDANWMTYISNDTYINNINIPGTHDSGTYDIGQLTNNKVANKIFSITGLGLPSSILSGLGQTQDMDITEQLESGIRYLDIRLANNERKPSNLFLSHGNDIKVIDTVPCINLKNKTELLYLTDVIEESINFLKIHYNETIIMHLKEESVDVKNIYNDIDNDNEFSTLLTSYTIFNDKYKNYFYNKNKIPKLGDVRGKIVLLTRKKYEYNTSGNTLGLYFPIPDMGGCIEYDREQRDYCHYYLTNTTYSKYIDSIPRIDNTTKSIKEICNEYDRCFPILTDILEIKKFCRIQDAYNLDGSKKLDLVLDVLNNDILSKYDNNFVNDKSFNFTINFMNVARVNSDTEYLFDDIAFKAGIEEASKYLNTRLTEYILNNGVNKNWFILDYPNPDVVRSIYQSNDPNNKELNKYTIEVSTWEKVTSFTKYHLSTIPIVGYAINEAGNTLYDIGETIVDTATTVGEAFIDGAKSAWNTFKSLFKRDFNEDKNKTLSMCLQRDFKSDKISIYSKCNESPKSEWYINSNGNYYNIISVYDNKCISYKDNKLKMIKCNKDDHKIDFTINYGVFCSRVDNTKCINGVFKLSYIPLRSKKYDNLTCSYKFVKYGYKCCSNCVNVDHEDGIGSWGFENNNWCGIPYKCLEDESSSDDEDINDNNSIENIDNDDDAPIITDYEIETDDINDEL